MAGRHQRRHDRSRLGWRQSCAVNDIGRRFLPNVVNELLEPGTTRFGGDNSSVKAESGAVTVSHEQPAGQLTLRSHRVAIGHLAMRRWSRGRRSNPVPRDGAWSAASYSCGGGSRNGTKRVGLIHAPRSASASRCSHGCPECRRRRFRSGRFRHPTVSLSRLSPTCFPNSGRATNLHLT